MDLEAIKGKTLDGDVYSQLAAHVAALEARATKAAAAQQAAGDAAKRITAERDAAFDKLGVSSIEEIDAIPDGKLAADAARQFDGKLKKAERERTEALAALDDMRGRYSADRKNLALEKAIASQKFIDAEDARALLERRIKSEGDDFLFKTADGKLLPLADGAALIAKTKPHLVQAPAAGKSGSGFKPATNQAPVAGNAPTLSPADIYAARQPQFAAAK